LDDGQTMAGAISTGTHNAAIHIGSMQDTVKGIHLVLLNETVFLQRASDPVVTDLYRNEIGADRIWSDDDLFAASLVNFGTFGIIHGFLIITEPLCK
jgi:FAD/FMN-containing dehydrogenase